MAKIYYDSDANLDLLKGKTIGVIGFGSQGHAHSLNLKESGCNVMVGELTDSEPWRNAAEAGLKVATAEEVAQASDIIVMLVPDQLHRQVYYNSIEKGLKKGNMLMFAHGFNIHYNQIIPSPDVDVAMIAPKCSRSIVPKRSAYSTIS